MRISKFSSAICAVAVCANFISARANDTPAQAAARAAMEQKMHELDAHQTATNTETAPAVVAPSSGMTQEQPGQPAAPPTIVVTSSGASLDTNDVPTAEMIQHSMMPLPGENQPAQPVQTPPPAVTIAPAPAETITTPAAIETAPAAAPVQTPAPVVTAPVETPVVAMPPAENPVETPPENTEAQAKAMQALQQKMAELDKQAAVTPPPAATEVQPPLSAPVQIPAVVAAPETQPVIVTPTREKSVNVNYPGKQPGLTPITAPPLPISPDIEAQLRALDAKYKADQISPKDYFQQREEILKGQ